MHAQLVQDTQRTPTSGPTKFVVDDDAVVRRSMTRLLGSAGWTTEAFVSAGDFLERVPINASGCVLLDVNMPGMTGLELQERMAEAGNAMPVVFLTGKIAYDLGIVEKTVKVHRSRVMEKMQAHTIAELVHLYYMAGTDFSRPAD